MSGSLPIFDHVSIVLVNPQHPGNVGAAARAMANMGLSRLIVTGNCDLADPQCKAMATKSAYPVVEGAIRVSDLKTALESFGFSIALSRRTGKARQMDFLPKQAAEYALSLVEKNDVGFVFGPEDHGLSYDEINMCQRLCQIPSVEKEGSLNLAQAVMIVAYELRLAAMSPPKSKAKRLATSGMLEGMYDQMTHLYLEMGFLDPENPEWIMQGLRRIYGRVELEEREVAILRGILSDTSWYLDHVAKTGERDGKRNLAALRVSASKGEEQ